MIRHHKVEEHFCHYLAQVQLFLRKGRNLFSVDCVVYMRWETKIYSFLLSMHEKLITNKNIWTSDIVFIDNLTTI